MMRRLRNARTRLLPLALPSVLPLALLLPLAACGGYNGPHYAGNAWDGRRGYDGNGDYGYDPEVSRAEARTYRQRAARRYPAPGPASDPWGPHIQQAAARFGVPERWIREVMRQESGGRQQSADGSLTTSSAGAMGLMQVMPSTYDMLRRRYSLGSDPYDPRNNILAGTAYIREMYDKFGAPAFLAAYNAGPDRLQAYLDGSNILPDETVNYLARVAPRLGTQVAMTGPLATYAGGNAGRGSTFAANAALRPTMLAAYTPVPDSDRAYAGGGLVGPGPGDADAGQEPQGPEDRAFDGGGLVSMDAPTGRLALPYAAAPAMATLPAARDAAPPPYAAPVAAGQGGGWGIQVGTYPDRLIADAAITAARQRAGRLLASAMPSISTGSGSSVFRARLVGLTASSALSACATLSQGGMPCSSVPPGS